MHFPQNGIQFYKSSRAGVNCIPLYFEIVFDVIALIRGNMSYADFDAKTDSLHINYFIH